MNEALQVKFTGISKAYGGVQALKDVSMEIRKGEVHALCGENGAGKSTLIKILTGSVRADEGTIEMAGVLLKLGDVKASEDAGIAVIHQESIAFLHLNAVQNIFAARELKKMGGMVLDWPAMRRETTRLLQQLGENFDQRCPLLELTVAQRQMVGIARAISKSCKILVMDEPTASLSARETEVLFRIIRQLRESGVSILYVSHRMEEIFELSDQVTVFRDGKYVATNPTSGVTKEELIRLMVGRELIQVEDAIARETDAPGKVLLEVKGLRRAGVFSNITFAVRAGEIVGMSGLVGAGRTEVARVIFGADRADGGEVFMEGRPLPNGSINAAMAAGVAMVPEDRQHVGLVLPMSVGANLSMAVLPSLTSGGLISSRREGALAQKMIGELRVKTPNADVAAQNLSGGNQQKLVIGKWLAANPRVLILDEPTRGVDVGAKAEIYKLIRQVAQTGMAILLISSDLPEVLLLSDRILVMRTGQIAGELSRAQATQEKALALAMPVGGGKSS